MGNGNKGHLFSPMDSVTFSPISPAFGIRQTETRPGAPIASTPGDAFEVRFGNTATDTSQGSLLSAPANPFSIHFGNQTDAEIRFFRSDKPYGNFSNFSRHPILVDDQVWYTVEHYYQAMKFQTTDPQLAEQISLQETPKRAARMARENEDKIRPDWEAVKVDVMRHGVRAKFFFYDELRQELLATGNMPILETNANDPFWGIGPDGKGQNIMGKILMEIREDLQSGREFSIDKDTPLSA